MNKLNESSKALNEKLIKKLYIQKLKEKLDKILNKKLKTNNLKNMFNENEQKLKQKRISRRSPKRLNIKMH